MSTEISNQLDRIETAKDNIEQAIRDKGVTVPSTAKIQDLAPLISSIPQFDTSDANAVAGNILLNKTAYVKGKKVTGTMPNNGAVTGWLGKNAAGFFVNRYNIPAGYHDGSGVVWISGETTSVTPKEYSQKIVPQNLNSALQEVTVGAIPTTYVGSGVTKRTSESLTASGATVTVPAGYYAESATKTISNGSATTPATTITANPSLSTTYTNGKGYKMTVSKTKSVTPTVTEGYVKSGTAGTITVSGSAYVPESVTGDPVTSTTENATVSIGYGQQMTIGGGYYPNDRIIRNSVEAGSCTVSGGGLSGGAAVTPTVTLSSGSDTNIDSTKVSVGAKDTTNYPYYFKVNGASSAGSSTVSRAAVTDAHTAGYIPAKAATTAIAADSKTVTVNAGSGSTYVGLKAGACTVSGGGLSVTNNYSGTPTVDITLDGQTTSGAAITTTKPTSGYYLTLGASSSALSGTTKVTRAAVTDAHTAGYIPDKSATTVIDAATASPTVTVNKGTKTEYVTIPSGSAKVTSQSITATNTITFDEDSGLITATASGSKSISPTVTEGYVKSGTAGTISVSGTNTLQLTDVGVGIPNVTTLADDEESEIYISATTTQQKGYCKGGKSGVVGKSIKLKIEGDTAIMYDLGDESKEVRRKVATATQATPSITVSSAGLITASATQTVGYVSAGTKSATKQLTTQGAKTVTPTTSNQTAVASGRYTTGTITVKGDSNLVAGNIKKGVSIFGVTGTHEGGATINTCTINVTFTTNTGNTLISATTFANGAISVFNSYSNSGTVTIANVVCGSALSINTTGMCSLYWSGSKQDQRSLQGGTITVPASSGTYTVEVGVVDD